MVPLRGLRGPAALDRRPLRRPPGGAEFGAEDGEAATAAGGQDT